MKNGECVQVNVHGKFHAFNLAKELFRYNYLGKLTTTSLINNTKSTGIPSDKIKTYPLLGAMNKFRRKIPFTDPRMWAFISKKLFDISNTKFTKNIKIVIGWDGSSLKTFTQAKKNGIVSICERGSFHVVEQLKILENEYTKLNIESPYFTNKYLKLTMNQQLKEYDIADYIVTPSLAAKQSFISQGFNPDKIKVINLGVDLSEFKSVQKTDNVFRVIYVGGLTIQKGSHYLLQAFHELGIKDCELWHIGTVGEEMEPFLREYKSDNIKLLGHKPQNQLFKYYSQGSVFCFPSLHDGFGMVIPQAMACGLPIITTCNAGASDIIENGKEGYVIPIASAESIKEKIDYLYCNQELCREMGDNSLNKVKKGNSWEDYGLKYKEFIESIKI